MAEHAPEDSPHQLADCHDDQKFKDTLDKALFVWTYDAVKRQLTSDLLGQSTGASSEVELTGEALAVVVDEALDQTTPERQRVEVVDASAALPPDVSEGGLDCVAAPRSASPPSSKSEGAM